MIEFVQRMFHNLKQKRHIKASRMELHQQLNQARKKAGLSVNEVAAHLDVGRVQVWRMEKNADWVSVGRLKQLASLYGIPAATLLSDNVDIGEADISYQLIEDAMQAVGGVSSNMAHPPSPEATRAAVVAVIRHQQKRWSEDSTHIFNSDEFKVLIEDYLQKEPEA